MRHRIWTGMCAAMVSVATAGILAQTTPQTPAPQTPSPTPQQTAPSSSDKKITLTGCLKAAPQMPGETAGAATTGAAGTTGTAGTAGAAGTTGAAGAATTAGTSGAATGQKFVLTAASASPADAATAANASQTYRLIANPAVLGEHVGKKLELTGTIDTTSTADPKDPSAAAPAFKVESGKIVAASCSE